jgi:hypothetical protein
VSALAAAPVAANAVPPYSTRRRKSRLIMAIS